MTALGLSPLEVLDSIHAAYHGAHVAQVYQGNHIADLVVMLAPECETISPAWVGCNAFA